MNDEATWDVIVRRLSALMGLALATWVLWDYLGAWRRERIVAEMRAYLPVIVEPDELPAVSASDVTAVLDRAAEVLRDGD